MPKPGLTPADPRPPSSLRGLWGACYAGLALLLAGGLIARFLLPVYLADPIRVTRTVPPEAIAVPGTRTAAVTPTDARIDPNSADWKELTRLPGVGEVIARRIVEYREQHPAPAGGPVFRTADDLGRIRGIGRRTVESIRPLLRFEPASRPDTRLESGPRSGRTRSQGVVAGPIDTPYRLP